MNRISLDSFQKELNQIREYLKHIDYVNKVANYDVLEGDNEQLKTLINNLKQHYKSFGRDKRIFEYKAVIISLYGLLEKYIEIWIKEYLDSLSKLIPNYNQIDEKIRNNHFEFSLKLINTITTRETAKYQHLKKEEVLQKLNSCIVSPQNYQINAEAFVLLSGNLKHKKIVELFRLLNINLNSKLVSNENLNHKIGLSKGEITRRETDILYNKVNDLVVRRNEIAHGSKIPELLAISELEAYIDFLEVYCQAIFEILFEELIKQESIHNFQKIKVVHNVWQNSILGFEIENYIIKVGNILIIETREGKFYKRPILEIQLNNKSYQELTIKEKTNIAVRVKPKIKENQTFYLVKNKK